MAAELRRRLIDEHQFLRPVDAELVDLAVRAKQCLERSFAECPAGRDLWKLGQSVRDFVGRCESALHQVEARDTAVTQPTDD